jgi:hypothetical protein
MNLRVLRVTMGLGLLMGTTLLTGCDELTNRDKLQKAGETVGRSATVIVDGIGEGIKRADKRQLVVGDELKKKGLRTGKFKVDKAESESGGLTGGKEPDGDNRLTVYCIFDKNFDRFVTVTLFDEAGEEYGRTKVKLTGTAGNARNVDFVFDPRTDIERGTKVVME